MPKIHSTYNPAEVESQLTNDVSVWKDIPGYWYHYRISDFGVVQRYWPNKDEWRTMSQYGYGGKKSEGVQRRVVKLTIRPKVAKEVFIADLMAELFMGGRENHKGMLVYHKNGCSTDYRLCNLAWGTSRDVGKCYGGAGRKSIEKVDRNGNVVDLFRSISECSEHEYISRKAVWSRLHHKLKDPYDLTGYTYRLERTSEEDD